MRAQRLLRVRATIIRQKRRTATSPSFKTDLLKSSALIAACNTKTTSVYNTLLPHTHTHTRAFKRDFSNHCNFGSELFSFQCRNKTVHRFSSTTHLNQNTTLETSYLILNAHPIRHSHTDARLKLWSDALKWEKHPKRHSEPSRVVGPVYEATQHAKIKSF